MLRQGFPYTALLPTCLRAIAHVAILRPELIVLVFPHISIASNWGKSKFRHGKGLPKHLKELVPWALVYTLSNEILWSKPTIPSLKLA